MVGPPGVANCHAGLRGHWGVASHGLLVGLTAAPATCRLVIDAGCLRSCCCAAAHRLLLVCSCGPVCVAGFHALIVAGALQSLWLSATYPSVRQSSQSLAGSRHLVSQSPSLSQLSSLSASCEGPGRLGSRKHSCIGHWYLETQPAWASHTPQTRQDKLNATAIPQVVQS